jgi:hypothetical protein
VRQRVDKPLAARAASGLAAPQQQLAIGIERRADAGEVARAGGNRCQRKASVGEGDLAGCAMRDNMDRPQLTPIVERIRHLPDGIARRAEHDRVHLRPEAA